LDGTTHPPEAERLRRAQEAAKRLAIGETRQDWFCVGFALLDGQNKAMLQAGCNKPSGGKYTFAFSKWFQNSGLCEVAGDGATRSNLIALIKNFSEVQQWLKDLPLEKSLTLNHPSVIHRHWKKSITTTKNKPPSAVAKLKESVRQLEEENKRYRELNGGNTFTAKDRPEDVVKILRATFSDYKLKEIRHLLGTSDA
jgi:hypothetical protein